MHSVWHPNMVTLHCAGPQLDIPHNVNPTQLEVLLNGLLNNEEKLPYSFYIEDQVSAYRM